LPFIAIIIGGILIVVAFMGTQTTLAQNLEKDVPGFFKWAIAIAVILGLGYVPGLRTPSRWLIGLVALVVVLTQGKGIFAGFQKFAQTGTQTAQQSAQSEQQAAQTAQQQDTAAQTAMAQLGNSTTSGTTGLAANASSQLASAAANVLTDPINMATMLGMA
jgi:hypothetical protein